MYFDIIDITTFVKDWALQFQFKISPPFNKTAFLLLNLIFRQVLQSNSRFSGNARICH